MNLAHRQKNSTQWQIGRIFNVLAGFGERSSPGSRKDNDSVFLDGCEQLAALGALVDGHELTVANQSQFGARAVGAGGRAGGLLGLLCSLRHRRYLSDAGPDDLPAVVGFGEVERPYA